MNRSGKFVLSLGGVLALGATVASVAFAGAPVGVSGAWTTGPLTPTGFKPAGVNIKLPGIVQSDWTGDLAGSTVATATFLLHPDGSVVAAPVLRR